MNSGLNKEAIKNLAQLMRNRYPGRGLIMGLNGLGTHFVQVYWIMGRSENSRNRVFKSGDDGRLYTEAADPAKVKDPSLIIYNAMRQNGYCSVVSNGAQTDEVADQWIRTKNLGEALAGWQYEPDAPNFTPRITGVAWLPPGDRGHYQISVLRKSCFDDSCDFSTYRFNAMMPGYGHCVTTYLNDGDPLPAFRGDPYVMPLPGNADDIADAYWDALNATNLVSLAVKFIPLDGKEPSTIRIINRH